MVWFSFSRPVTCEEILDWRKLIFQNPGAAYHFLTEARSSNIILTSHLYQKHLLEVIAPPSLARWYDDVYEVLQSKLSASGVSNLILVFTVRQREFDFRVKNEQAWYARQIERLGGNSESGVSISKQQYRRVSLLKGELPIDISRSFQFHMRGRVKGNHISPFKLTVQGGTGFAHRRDCTITINPGQTTFEFPAKVKGIYYLIVDAPESVGVQIKISPEECSSPSKTSKLRGFAKDDIYLTLDVIEFRPPPKRKKGPKCVFKPAWYSQDRPGLTIPSLDISDILSPEPLLPFHKLKLNSVKLSHKTSSPTPRRTKKLLY